MSAGEGPAGQPAPPLRLLSINPNGMRGSTKRHELFHALSEGPWDIMLVQEAHTTSVAEVEGWLREGAGQGLPFRGVCFVNPHTSTSAGTITLRLSVTPLRLSHPQAGACSLCRLPMQGCPSRW